ncbi:MAG: 30S ribosomal protein S17 [Candidatus Pacearchaeota archaeon]
MKKTKEKKEENKENNDSKLIVSLRGRAFKGEVIKKFDGRVVIFFERFFFVPKYERYEKRKTVIHARLPNELKDIEIGDIVEVKECRPLSKMIHFVVTKKIRGKK